MYNISMGGAPYGLPLPVSPGRQSERRGDVIMNEITSSIYKHSMKLERRTASLYVQNTGCQQCPPGYGWGPGVRNHFLLHHVISGKGVYVSRDKRYELAGGDTFLVYPGPRSSIRFERLVEGIQAYEKVLVLQEEFRRDGRTREADALREMLEEFDAAALADSGAAAIIARANNRIRNF